MGHDEIIHMITLDDRSSGNNEAPESSAMVEGHAQNSTGPPLLFNSKPFKKLKASDCYFVVPSKLTKGKTEQSSHVMWHSLLNIGWKEYTVLDNPTLLVNCIGDLQNAKQVQEGHNTLKSIIRNLFKNSANTWIFTEAYANPFSKAIGEAIKDLENTFNTVNNEETNVKITSFGFASWEGILLKDHIQDTDYLEKVRNVKNRKGLPLCDSNTHYVLMKAEDPTDNDNGDKKLDLRYDLLKKCKSSICFSRFANSNFAVSSSSLVVFNKSSFASSSPFS